MRWAALAAALWLASGTAHAEPSPQELNAARALANAAFAKFTSGDYADAYDRFKAADDIFHAPTHLLYMARCKAELGELLAARDLYQRTIDEELAEDAPQPFVDARNQAATDLAALRARIPTVAVSVQGPAAEDAAVTLDGEPIEPGGAPIEVAVGTHEVKASAAGFEPASRSVDLVEGARETVAVALRPVAAPPPPPTMPTSPLELPIPPLVVAGVGVVGVGIGAVTGIVALGKASDLNDACPDRSRCPIENQSLEDDANTFGTVSTVSFVAGGVCLAAGAGWLAYTLMGDAPTSDTAVVAPLTTGSELGVVVRF